MNSIREKCKPVFFHNNNDIEEDKSNSIFIYEESVEEDKNSTIFNLNSLYQIKYSIPVYDTKEFF